MALTQAQIDLLAGFRFHLPDDVARTEAAIAAIQAQVNLWQSIDAAYAAAQQVFLERQDAALQAKAMALAAANPDPDLDGTLNAYTVEYGGTHPENGGVVPTDWTVKYATPYVGWSTGTPFDSTPFGGASSVISTDHGTTFVAGVDYSDVSGVLTNLGGLPASVLVVIAIPVEVVVYSHGVAWDENQAILDTEAGWLDYHGLRSDVVWGSTKKALNLGTALTTLQRWLTLLTDREDGALLLGGIDKYRDWITEDSLVTLQTVVAVTSLDGTVVFTLGQDYTTQLATSGATIFNSKGLPATVRVTA